MSGCNNPAGWNQSASTLMCCHLSSNKLRPEFEILFWERKTNKKTFVFNIEKYIIALLDVFKADLIWCFTQFSITATDHSPFWTAPPISTVNLLKVFNEMIHKFSLKISINKVRRRFPDPVEFHLVLVRSLSLPNYFCMSYENRNGQVSNVYSLKLKKYK